MITHPVHIDMRKDTTMSNRLVAYFSATGTTRAAAHHLAEAAGADIKELTPTEPYTDADLNWTDRSSRCVREHEDLSIRPQIADVPDVSGYDVVFVGYPLWWDKAPNIIRTFLEGQDFSGKTVVAFATSSTSTEGATGDHLHDSCSASTRWLTGRRIAAHDSAATLATWINDLGL